MIIKKLIILQIINLTKTRNNTQYMSVLFFHMLANIINILHHRSFIKLFSLFLSVGSQIQHMIIFIYVIMSPRLKCHHRLSLKLKVSNLLSYSITWTNKIVKPQPHIQSICETKNFMQKMQVTCIT